ncbi:MAG: type VI secretion system lipoprotein TssJ [Aquabacterium sp.]
MRCGRFAPGIVATAMLCACASSQAPQAATQPGSAGLGAMATKALEWAGLKKREAPDAAALPQVPDSALPDWKITWRVHASDALNVSDEGQSLALLIRVYKLRHADTFLQMPADAFGDPVKEKALLQDDLLGAREIQLLPGQRLDNIDKLAREARYLGIVALYRKPATNHWRYAFDASSIEKSGLHIGAHACALSVPVGDAIGRSARSIRSVLAGCP